MFSESDLLFPQPHSSCILKIHEEHGMERKGNPDSLCYYLECKRLWGTVHEIVNRSEVGFWVVHFWIALWLWSDRPFAVVQRWPHPLTVCLSKQAYLESSPTLLLDHCKLQKLHSILDCSRNCTTGHLITAAVLSLDILLLCCSYMLTLTQIWVLVFVDCGVVGPRNNLSSNYCFLFLFPPLQECLSMRSCCW